MMRGISVVIPAFNEAAHLPTTIAALIRSLRESDFAAELVLVDDGSTDGSADVVRQAVGNELPLRVLQGRRAGRFNARRLGVSAATAEWTLLLDARVQLYPYALKFVCARLTPNSSVWNGHVTQVVDANPYGAFGNVLVHIAWAEYFREPRETSFGLADFDHFPKGTTCFLSPRWLLIEAMDAFKPRIPDWRLVNDDTQLIRWIAARHRIHLSPEFGCYYQPRTTFRAFLAHAVHRGSVFFDGHARRESRFYPVAVGFYPVSGVLAVCALRRPMIVAVAALASVAGACAFAARTRRPAFEKASFALLTPMYAVGHGVGMWRALALFVRTRLAGPTKP
jgi:glycosyltransferase involved in cell wall biosynthesis